jgi:hypothetical protein
VTWGTVTSIYGLTGAGYRGIDHPCGLLYPFLMQGETHIRNSPTSDKWLAKQKTGNRSHLSLIRHAQCLAFDLPESARIRISGFNRESLWLSERKEAE